MKQVQRLTVSNVYRLLGLVLFACLALVACQPAEEEESLTDPIDVETLSAEATAYIELARDQIVEWEDTIPEAVIVESVTEPATTGEAYIIDMASEGFLYEFHGQDGVVVLAADPVPVTPIDDDVSVPDVDAGQGVASVANSADLVQALEQAGAIVAIPTEPEPAADLFSVPGQTYYVNGEPVYIYEYADSDSAAADAGRVSPTGYEIGPLNSEAEPIIAEWVSTPRFFRAGNLLVLYVGDAGETLSLLEAVTGPPFAGG